MTDEPTSTADAKPFAHAQEVPMNGSPSARDVWLRWVQDLPRGYYLDDEWDRELLARDLADVVAKVPSGDAVAADERQRRQQWQTWLASTAATLDLADHRDRERLAELLAAAVDSTPQPGTWGGWQVLRPLRSVWSVREDELRDEVLALSRAASRPARMILEFLAKHALDLVRAGIEQSANQPRAFVRLLENVATADPLLPALADRLGHPLADVRAFIAGEYLGHIERTLNPHIECRVAENCGANDCPPAIAARKRAAEGAGDWGGITLGVDAGGRRHFLDGRPITCGTTLELQAIEDRSDDYGSYSIPLQRGVRVRYEADLGAVDSPATLHVDVAGYEFVSRLEPWMRFRWPGDDTKSH